MALRLTLKQNAGFHSVKFSDNLDQSTCFLYFLIRNVAQSSLDRAREYGVIRKGLLFLWHLQKFHFKLFSLFLFHKRNY